MDWIIPSLGNSKVGSSRYLLPQPEEMIRAAWRDQKLAAEILKREESDAKTRNAVLKWLESLGWMATLSRVDLTPEVPREAVRLVLCGDGNRAWSGGGALPHPGEVSLSPMSRGNVRSQFEILL
jgi:hypothetical protein